MRNRRTLFLIGVSALLIMGFQNCGGGMAFSQGAANASSQSSTGPSGGGSGGVTSGGGGSNPSGSCTPQTTTENLRIIFMVDDSGSTATTDPNQYYRVTVLKNFLADYSSKANFSYNFGWFSDSSVEWDTKSSSFVSSPVSPMGNANDLSNALTAFEAIGPQSGTNYKTAFSGIEAVIGNVAQVGDGWNYIVVFMSDGQPGDLGSTAASELSGSKTLADNLNSYVTAFGSKSTLSTVYFGAESDSNSIANLSGMASEGGGQFVDTNKVTDLSISDIITIPCN